GAAYPAFLKAPPTPGPIEKTTLPPGVVARVEQDRIETELHEPSAQPTAAPGVRLAPLARPAAREAHLHHFPVARVREWYDDWPHKRKALLPHRVLDDHRHDLPPPRARGQPGGVLGHHAEEVGD